jgi:MgsA AAA+ ATPase C terminal
MSSPPAASRPLPTNQPQYTEDPYPRTTSPRGIPVDQLVSVLQKEIRRSHVDNAVLAAYEMHSTSKEVAAHLWRRLRVIAVEDVGMGAPLAPVLLRELQADYDDSGGTDWMQVVHAVRYLATAPKDRTSSEHADYARTMVEAGKLAVDVPDYALCVHTRAGRQMGRGLLHWWENGAQVRDELPSADHTYRDALISDRHDGIGRCGTPGGITTTTPPVIGRRPH